VLVIASTRHNASTTGASGARSAVASVTAAWAAFEPHTEIQTSSAGSIAPSSAVPAVSTPDSEEQSASDVGNTVGIGGDSGRGHHGQECDGREVEIEVQVVEVVGLSRRHIAGGVGDRGGELNVATSIVETRASSGAIDSERGGVEHTSAQIDGVCLISPQLNSAVECTVGNPVAAITFNSSEVRAAGCAGHQVASTLVVDDDVGQVVSLREQEVATGVEQVARAFSVRWAAHQSTRCHSNESEEDEDKLHC